MAKEPKTISLKIPFAGYSRVRFGQESQILNEYSNKHSIFIKLLGDEPENAGEEIKIFTFGIFFLANAGKMRLGFIKRHQTLVKA